MDKQSFTMSRVPSSAPVTPATAWAIGLASARSTMQCLAEPAQPQFCEEAKMSSSQVPNTGHLEATRNSGLMRFTFADGRRVLARLALAMFVLSGLSLSTVASGQEILLAQATPSQAIPSNAPNSPPNITPNATPSATSNTTATCMSGCNTALFSCNGPCFSTSVGSTVLPSGTTAGITNNPAQCLQNCSTQMQTCQRNCALDQ
jgi:hypothetical protein